MEKRFAIISLLMIMFCSINLSCGSDDSDPEITIPALPDPNLLNDFWFGYYQEDATTNPEDPLPGFIYLKVPESGNFEGELYFSYEGCEGGIDIGSVQGTVANNSLNGSWAGVVDGKTVGGDYAGMLVNNERYEGTFTNSGGKVEIVCDPDFSYFVAPNGTWYVQKKGNNDILDIKVDTTTNPLTLNWNASNQSGLVYNVVFADAKCLDSNLNLEQCLMWSGSSSTNSIVYGQGLNNTVPPKNLVSGKTYLASITCINATTGEATVSSNIVFIAK